MTPGGTIRTWREGKQYIAHALPIDVMSSGPTPEAAYEALREAIRLFIRTAADSGTLNTILEQCGFTDA
jgi:predicted RNase H-like HicB family nuclease